MLGGVRGVVLDSDTVLIVGDRVNCLKFVSNEERLSSLLSSVSGDAVSKSIGTSCSGVNSKSSYNGGGLSSGCEGVDVLAAI